MLGVKMINGIKKSDPIIDYPSLTKYGYEHIDDWLEENKKDDFLIKFYCQYMNKTITRLLTKLDDQNATVIRRGYKLLEKWEN